MNKKKTPRKLGVYVLKIPAAGVEPARCCHRWILSPVRLPIPPCWHMYMITYMKYFVNLAIIVNFIEKKCRLLFNLNFNYIVYNIIVSLWKKYFMSTLLYNLI